jgi:peptidoglycan/LPS O-acetylase OafA/YrhL
MAKEYSDIQSIRAIAVLLVVGYHLNSEFFKYGYIGVDIFFVISGFIITHLILKKKSFNFLEFYQKRIARIFPAMTLVTLLTVFFGSILLRTDDLINLSLQGILSLFGLSNFYFASTQIGYFEVESFKQPLLHMWSLSTELQFYFLAPIFILFLKRINPVIRLLSLVFVFFLSLAFYVDFVTIPSIDSYYLLTSRLWEFIIGAGIALVNNKKRIEAFAGKSATLAALMLIIGLNIFGLKSINSNLIEVLLVLVSTIMILQAVSNGNVQKSFSPKLTVFLGDLSYSIYLWHWPIIYFLKNWTTVSKVELTLITLTLTFVLSVLSYFFWENRFRGNKSSSQKVALLSFISITILFLFISSNRNLVEFRFTGQKQELSNFEIRSGFTDKETKCLSDYGETYEVWDGSCLIKRENSEQSIALIWGDSHVAAIADAFEADEKFKEIELSRASTTACPPIKSMNSLLSPNSKCKKNNAHVWDYISTEKPQTLILVARWFIYANYEWYKSGLSSLQITIDKAKNAGVENIILIGSSPEWGEPLPDLLWKTQLSTLNIPTEMENSRAGNLRDINFNLREMSEAAMIQYIDPMDIWCISNNCITHRNLDLFYTIQIDGDHLSVTAAREITNLIIK